LAGTIVYVDNQPDLPAGLGRELGRLGFRLQHAASADEAWSLVRDGTARLLMLEVLLDRDLGWSLIQRVRRLAPPLGEIPIVILTRGERTPELYGRAIELGADDFLARPVLRAEILDAILECIETRDSTLPAELGPTDFQKDADGTPAGALQEVPLPELLLRLREDAATGVLFLQEFEGLAVQLRNGSPIALASSRGTETFADFLMRTKRISGDEHEQMLERAAGAGESEPQAAVSIGALSVEEVRVALSDRSSEPLLEAFAWTSGSWRFEQGKRLRSGHELSHGAAHILARGVLQWTPSRAIRAMLDRRGAMYLAAAHRPPCHLEDLSPRPCEPALLGGWSGEQTVAEVLESGMIGERELYALLAAGLVEADTHAPLELSELADVAEPTETVPPLELGDPDPVRDAAGAADRAEPGPEPLAPDRRRDAPRPVESVPAPTAARAVEADSAARAESTSADHEVLDRSRDAERHFVEGDGHLTAKRYEDAVASFGLAVHLDPDQGEYLAHLGYAMFMKDPASGLVRKEALEHIARGIKLAGEQWKPLLFLARVFIGANDDANARKVLKGAIRRHPDCEPLRTELARMARAKSEPKRGLLSSLRRWLRR
jgi:DNA-binding response OmpR family regulator